MTSKKNSFWRLCFSLIPGAGEMYMGFLKMGLSLMSLFLFIIFTASFLHLEELISINFIVWFYSFFHVHNLASLPDEEFYAVEDNYLFHFSDSSINGQDFFQRNRRTIAAVVIVLGIVMTWRSLLDFIRALLPWEIYDYITTFTYQLPRMVTGIAIIALGVLMIRGKKKELDMDFDAKEASHPSMPFGNTEETPYGHPSMPFGNTEETPHSDKEVSEHGEE